MYEVRYRILERARFVILGSRALGAEGKLETRLADISQECTKYS